MNEIKVVVSDPYIHYTAQSSRTIHSFLIGQETFHEWGCSGTTSLRLSTTSNHSACDVFELLNCMSTFQMVMQQTDSQ